MPKLKRPPATGLFIAFEGVEGAGKGTQLKLAEEYLRAAGHAVLVTREPGGTELGEKIRLVLLDPKTGKLDARSEALLFAAARAQSVTTVIRPALADGKVVICDRYVDSSLAYQGWARGLGEQDVLTLNVWATQGLFPDLVILLHLEPERGLLRSTEAPDRMELEGQDFHAKVADAYLKIAEEHPERFVVVDADKAPSEVFEDVKAALDRVIKDREDQIAPSAADTAGLTGDPTGASGPRGSIARMSAVLDRVPGQDAAMAFLIGAAERPHHAYVFAGPEGSGKSIAATAFTAALLCADGGCGACRSCRLALEGHHPNVFLIEPEGRDIHVDTIREEVWTPASRTAPEPGRKVFVIREADRLSPAAADTLLKVLEEPPADAVFLLMSARAHELPDTVLSRCHVVTFTALSGAVRGGGAGRVRASARCARVSRRGWRAGTSGRARRLAVGEDGLRFRDAAREALIHAAEGPPGALEAADIVLVAAGEYRKGLKAELEHEMAPFVDERGRPEDAYRGAIKRIEIRFQRKERRAERDYVDWVLLAVSSLLRDRIASAVGGGRTS